MGPRPKTAGAGAAECQSECFVSYTTAQPYRYRTPLLPYQRAYLHRIGTKQADLV